MSTHLSGYDDLATARNVVGALLRAGVSARAVRLHLSKAQVEHHGLTQFDEQATGGLTTNLLSLFDDLFEWGSLPIDTSGYAATVRRGGAVVGVETDSDAEQRTASRVLAEAPPPALQSGWIADR